MKPKPSTVPDLSPAEFRTILLSHGWFDLARLIHEPSATRPYVTPSQALALPPDLDVLQYTGGRRLQVLDLTHLRPLATPFQK
jgi:hypothetical protein